MFKLILTPEQHAEIATRIYALAQAYADAGCHVEADAIRANANWHHQQSQKAA